MTSWIRMTTPRQRLIDERLPVWDFSETHRRTLSASSRSVVYATARHLDFSASWITRTLLHIRGIRGVASLDAILERGEFSIVAERPPEEFVIWVEVPDRLHIAWNFEFAAVRTGFIEVSTSTRIRCLTSRSRRLFRLYWLIVRPFSGLIRREMLRCLESQVRIQETSSDV